MEHSPPWSLVSVTGPDRRPLVAAQRHEDGVVLQIDGLPEAEEVVALLDDWDRVEPVLRDFDPAVAEPSTAMQLLAPLRYPRKVLCSGPNFWDHLAEMGEDDLGPDWSPYFFLKPPTTSIVGPEEAVPVPADPSARADWEGELGVVIGRGGVALTPQDASDHIAGFTVVDDISLRGPHRRPDAPAPFVWDWLASKGADGTLPVGPGVVPHWLVPDPQALTIVTTVNGEVMQDGRTADMVVDVPHLVAAASHLTRLEPGDLIATGTPAGVGAGRGVFLQPGDVVEVHIDGVGHLRNPVTRR